MSRRVSSSLAVIVAGLILARLNLAKIVTDFLSRIVVTAQNFLSIFSPYGTMMIYGEGALPGWFSPSFDSSPYSDSGSQQQFHHQHCHPCYFHHRNGSSSLSNLMSFVPLILKQASSYRWNLGCKHSSLQLNQKMVPLLRKVSWTSVFLVPLCRGDGEFDEFVAKKELDFLKSPGVSLPSRPAAGLLDFLRIPFQQQIVVHHHHQQHHIRPHHHLHPHHHSHTDHHHHPGP